jgi:hypothetical protein
VIVVLKLTIPNTAAGNHMIHSAIFEQCILKSQKFLKHPESMMTELLDEVSADFIYSGCSGVLNLLSACTCTLRGQGIWA